MAALLLVLLGGAARGAESTSCEICHARTEAPPDPAGAGAAGAHGAAGLSCHDCHGGDPDPALAGDPVAAKSETLPTNPYRGVPARSGVAGFCGRCHSDPVFMRRFDPTARVDQEREYWTSRHGLALAQGDDRVPTCVGCHGSHGIRSVDDLDSPVFPSRVARTCASCHADPAVMEGRKTDRGDALPVDQYALWSRSVHAKALLEKGDLSAPTCNDCHGNHGATPPDVESVASVCGQCHPREAQLFRQSPKRDGLRRHQEFLEAAGDEGCATCHADPERHAGLEGLESLGECTSCHGNHGIVRPTIAMLSPLPETPCAFCHEARVPDDRALLAAEAAVERYRATRDGLIASATALGLAGAERFDWLVDRALSLPFHTARGDDRGGSGELRPEFERLFSKFRIGRTRFAYRDPVSGDEVLEEIRRCSGCHSPAPLLADAPRGLEVAGELLGRMAQLTALTAAAERTVLRARRGGVDTSRALGAIDASVDAQVDLEVLVHAFRVSPESEFVRTHEAGVEHARSALALARAALDELESRRRGLASFLIVVAIVLAALGLKIRQLSARERPGSAAPRH